VVPVLLFAVATLFQISKDSQVARDQGQADTVRALALAVDGEVHSWKAALAALAESKSAQPNRWAEFYEEARQVGAQHEGWVVLTVASGEQIFNTLLPYGAPLQKTSSPETIDAIFREGKPIVSDLIWGKNAQRYLVAVAAPVVRGGKVVHCLTLNFSPDRLTRLLLRQQLPASWVAAINDQQRRVVARSVLADTRVGKPTVEWFAAATRAAESGIVTGPLIDGRLGQIAFQRLQEVPWVVALVVPVAELQSKAPIWRFVIVGVILGSAAVVMAVFMGRKITRPVARLAQAGKQVLQGESVDFGDPSGIREVQDLRRALIEAAVIVRAHAGAQERAAEALRQANAALEARVEERTAALAKTNEALQVANASLHEEIDDHKAAEEKIQSLARFPSENPNPILRLDSDGRILFANTASDAVLHEWRVAVDSRAPDPWPATIRDALTSHSRTTVELVCADRTYIVFVTPVPDAGYVNLYMSDITARKAAEQTLTKTLAELERSNRELEQFAYVASHDLQEPLRMVASYTQLLAKRYGDRLDQDAKDFIGFAVDGATRMQRLIQDLLAYSRVTTRGAAFGPTDAQIALRDALRNLEAVIQETEAVVTQDPLPTVRADATQLTQVFQNLVGNAVKFHGEAPPRVHVTVTAQDAQWVFSVTDNGIGIDPQYFERIFVIFQRLHPSHRYPGTGIGLALCQRIVDRHGGRMWVESAPGRGASFYFTLPRREARDS
jgi:signal transduction histidine kinase